MLKVENLSHSFENNLLFENLSFEVDYGKSISIMGNSGSGKSTLLHILSTFCSPSQGKVFINDLDIYNLDEDRILKLRREYLSIIFQSHYLIRGMNMRENLEVASMISGKKIDMDLLKLFDIEKNMELEANSMSGGEQQRLSIARALIKKPKIVFADEPTGNLDKDMSLEVIKTLSNYTKDNGAILILITHEQEYGNMCDINYTLEDKKLKRV